MTILSMVKLFEKGTQQGYAYNIPDTILDSLQDSDIAGFFNTLKARGWSQIDFNTEGHNADNIWKWERC
jgi:hypothetical protein